MYQEEYLSLTDIAEFFGCGTSTVQRHLIKHNIPRRPMNELNHGPRRKVPCPRCEKPKSGSKYTVCKDCWAKEHGRTRRASGRIRPLDREPKKRKFEWCLGCRGWIATWNRSGYCAKCWKLTRERREAAPRFCILCEKSISYANQSGLCPDCSNGKRSKKTIFKRKESLKIIDHILSNLNTEEETKNEVMIFFMNLLRRRFFLGYTGNNNNILKGGN